MTTTTAPAPAPASTHAHFEVRPTMGTVSCYGLNHRGERPMKLGVCSGCGTMVAWARGRMIPVTHRDGRVTVACWFATHDCAPVIESQYEMAAEIWHQTNHDLSLRNMLRVQIITLTDVRPDVVARGGDVERLDETIANLRAQLA